MAARCATTANRRTRRTGSITNCVLGCSGAQAPTVHAARTIVTGAGAGIGAAIARAFADEGARVVVSDIDAAAAEEVAASIDGAIAITADVTDETQVENLVARTVSTFGQLNVVVPNAGIATTTPLTETSFADWRKVMSVNLDGVFLTIRHALPELLKPGSGSIVTISSISGTTGSPLIGSYAAAKAAVRSLTQTLSAELRFHGIRANALLPGFIDTNLVTSHQRGFEGRSASRSGALMTSWSLNRPVTGVRRRLRRRQSSSPAISRPGATEARCARRRFHQFAALS